MRANLRVIKKKVRKSRSGGRLSGGGGCQNFEKTMKTLLLQNQQIIIQQQNMMFMVMKQFQPQVSLDQATIPTTTSVPTSSGAATSQANSQSLQSELIHLDHHSHHHQQSQQQFHQHQMATGHVQISSQEQHTLQPLHNHHIHNPHSQSHIESQLPFTHHQINEQQQQSQSQQQTSSRSAQSNNQTGHDQQNHHHHNQQQQQQQHHHQSQSQQQQQLQQVASHLQAEDLGAYLTPVASEQDPISDGKQPDDEDISALLENDNLLNDNLLYNPQTDIGQITPFKNHAQHHSQHHQQAQDQHQTPSYYSSGCESLTTPRVEQPRQTTTANISQNVVKNLADSFKSPSKPKINVQILSGTATRNMKNNKAKIIQRMNISEFLRHVHQDNNQSPHQQPPLKNSATQ